MSFFQFLTAAPAEGAGKIVFDPSRFVACLRYMGLGMLVIFAIIGVIILTTILINKVFSK